MTLSRLGREADDVPAGRASAGSSVRFARDGSRMWWGGEDTPGPPAVLPEGSVAHLTVAVSPSRPGHSVTIDYRVNGGPIRETAARSEFHPLGANPRMFLATLPGAAEGWVEFLPVLRFAGQPISSRLAESAESNRYRVGGVAKPTPDAASTALPKPKPRWAWDTRFLFSLSASVRKQAIGPTADGLRINWLDIEGRFAGPDLSGVFLPGAADWMRIRPDGMAIVDARACLETRAGARIDLAYGGRLDLGVDGYARALRADFPEFPSLVVTPTFATADNRYEWLNRAQCIGVGRVDAAGLRYGFDAYLVRVGDEMRSSGANASG